MKIETMKVVSLNTGLPREVMWHGSIVTTAIFKKPVTGRVRLARLNLDGDRQADLKVHGGVDKAVYCYPIEHTTTGGRSCPAAICPSGCSARTSRLKESLTIRCILAISSRSAPRP